MSYQRHTPYHPFLAGFNSNGKAWVNPEVRKRLGKRVEDRIMVHQETFEKEFSKFGTSWTEAREKALRKEHEGMTQEEISQYEGRLGALENELKRNPPKIDPIELDIMDEREAGPNYRAQAAEFEKEGKKEDALVLRGIAKDEDKHRKLLEKLEK